MEEVRDEEREMSFGGPKIDSSGSGNYSNKRQGHLQYRHYVYYVQRDPRSPIDSCIR